MATIIVCDITEKPIAKKENCCKRELIDSGYILTLKPLDKNQEHKSFEIDSVLCVEMADLILENFMQMKERG